MSKELDREEQPVTTEKLDNLAWQDPTFDFAEIQRAVDIDAPLEDEPSEAMDSLLSGIEEIVTSIETSRTAKQIGNELFLRENFDEAISQYTTAIEYCPPDEEYKGELAKFYANRAACYTKFKSWENVILDCTSALDLDERYVKALLRRSLAFESLERLEEALADLKKVSEIEPSTIASDRTLRSRYQRLERVVQERQEKLKEETMDKLKDVGNSLLGHFGLSLDNFKMEQNPDTGSYNISFQQNK